MEQLAVIRKLEKPDGFEAFEKKQEREREQGAYVYCTLVRSVSRKFGLLEL